MDLESTQPLAEIVPSLLHVPIVLKPLNFLEPSGPAHPCLGIVLPLFGICRINPLVQHKWY
jgi:hypothetical protein